MDNPSTESSALNLNQAADAFNAFLNPSAEPEKKQEGQPPAVEEAKTEPVEAAQAEETAPDGADETLTIEVDGKPVTLTKAELAEAYKSGLRQADYTKKTMEVSEQRKAADAEIQKAQQERAVYAQNLLGMQSALQQALQEQQRTDWEQLLNNDPQEYLKQRHLYEQRQAALQQNQAEQERVANQFQAEQHQARQEHLKQQQDMLLAKLPQWSDSKKAEAEKLEIRNYLLNEGYDQNLVDNLADANMVVTARKAMLFDQMVAKAQAAEKKVATLPTKVEKPGSGSAPTLDRRTAGYQRLAKSGRVEDAAGLIASLL